MKRLLLRTLFFLIPFLWSIYVSSQPKRDRDCSSTCFSSRVVSADKISSSCTAYELEIAFSGECAHALSHYSVAVPCGNIENVWNSQNWKVEIGSDPTTHMSGFKIDDIAGFGEGSLSSFRVKFTLCAQSESCAAELECWQPVVAYKASTCVNYETLTPNCKSLKASLEKQDASCYGSANGSLSVVVEDGQEPFTFLWSNGSTAQMLSGLSAGNYSVLIRDASGAEITLEETLLQGEAITVSGIPMPASCNGAANGSIDLSVSGGAGPYSYSWNNGATSEDLQGVPGGQYSVVVTDSRACDVTTNFTIANSSSIAITNALVRPDCNDTNGSIDITVSGGTAPYSYQWSNAETTEDISGIGEGLYTVTVADQSGCVQEKSFFLKENNTLLLKGTTSPTSCIDDASGAVDITVTGGSGPYTIVWSNGETSEDLAGVKSGFYTVVVKDAKGCSITGGYAVSKTTFQVARTVVQPTCYGENNGSITLQPPVGGSGPFTYEWSNGETGTSVSDLGPGTYTVTVTDATGCSRSLSSTISSPSAISASSLVSNSSCNADGYFNIDLTASGGTSPYTYQWSDGNTAEDLTGLSKGTYTVVITDAHGCSISKDILVEGEPATVSCFITELSAAPLCGSADNTLTTPVTDGDSYSWTVESTDGSWTLSNDNAQTVAFLAGAENSSAIFTLVITKEGCSKSCTYTVSACTPQDNGGGTDPGEEEPGGGEPGGEEPGAGGTQACDECFSTNGRLTDVSGECRTYEMVVNTNGLCRHDLSHWTLAIPCGTIHDMWNSEGWKMEFGKDPTTGLHGLKVDDINSFGKVASSFVVRFTLCGANNCELTSWAPTVAYKAGQCVGLETSSIESPTAFALSVYPNPFDEVINFEWIASDESVSLEIIDQYGNTISRSTVPERQHENYFIKLESSSLPKGMYYYRMSVRGKTYQGKISKR